MEHQNMLMYIIMKPLPQNLFFLLSINIFFLLFDYNNIQYACLPLYIYIYVVRRKEKEKENSISEMGKKKLDFIQLHELFQVL